MPVSEEPSTQMHRSAPTEPGERVDEEADWLARVKHDVTRSKRHWHVVRHEGEKDIERGLEITKIARSNLHRLEYVDHALSQPWPSSVWDDSIIQQTGVDLAGTVSVHTQGVRRVAEQYADFGMRKQEEHLKLMRIVNGTASTSGSAVYSVSLIRHQIEVIVPGYAPAAGELSAQDLPPHQQLLDELAALLEPLGPKWVTLLEASEERLHAEELDHLSHAAHSMRDLFEEILRVLAPSEAVKQQPWFEDTPEAPGGVSRRSRIRHALYGSGEAFEEEELSQLDQVAAGAKTALDLIIARDHDHDPNLSKHAVEDAIDHARFALVQVLKGWLRRADQG